MEVRGNSALLLIPLTRFKKFDSPALFGRDLNHLEDIVGAWTGKQIPLIR
jgi:hypothetical protein